MGQFKIDLDAEENEEYVISTSTYMNSVHIDDDEVRAVWNRMQDQRGSGNFLLFLILVELIMIYFKL